MLNQGYFCTQATIGANYSEDNIMKLTEHFTLEELTNSPTAKRLNIDNTPTKAIISNLSELSQLLENIRTIYNKPIIVTSGYRCERLNKAVGGVKTSQHVKGQAADIRSISDSVEDNKELFNVIVGMVLQKDIEVGQVIDEYNYNWVHVSTPHLNNNNQILHIHK